MADRTIVPRVFKVMTPAILFAGFLLTACATDNVTNRTRLPYIDDMAPPSQVVPPAYPEQPVLKKNEPDNKPVEAPK
jgi:hypothetical protein